MVTGPGNIYSTAAKRLLRGLIGIDSEAGPTEIAVLADDTADPAHVAADLISQAEHDPLAGAVLVTTSEQLADAVLDAGARRRWRPPSTASGSPTALGAASPASCWSTTSTPGWRSSTPTPPSTWRSRPGTPARWPLRVRNAGAVFVGPWAPVSLGDYCAGSNHVLPTGGCARHSSGLSVQSFLRGIHVVEYTSEALAEVAGHVDALADAEDLPAHAAAVRVRAAPHDRRWTSCPLRPSCAGARPTAPRSSTCRYALNTNENPHPLPPALLADLRRGAGRRRARSSTATPTGTPSALRADLAGYLRRTGGEPVAPAQVWAANGSNEVLQQVLQAFGGAGPHRAGLHAVLLDAPDHRAGTGTAWVDGHRRADFTIDVDGRGRAGAGACGRTSSS